MLSPRQIITDIPLRTPPTTMGQYVQGHFGGTDYIELERLVCTLNIGAAGNGIGHTVLKIKKKKKKKKSVNRIAEIPMSGNFIESVNQILMKEGQPEGIVFSNNHGNITVINFLLNHGEDDSNASDESFKFYDTYQKEFNTQLDQ